MAIATSVDLDQTAHPRSLIRVRFSQILFMTKPIMLATSVDSYQTAAQADLSLRWTNIS